MDRQRLEGLDLLRGVAAVGVMFMHIPLSWWLPVWAFSKAYLAVDFFFMLSGYVLTRTYHARFAEGLTTRGFMVKRIRRLWPVIAVGTVIGLLSQLDIRPLDENLKYFLMGLAIVPFLGGSAVFPLNGPIWSIYFELFANLFHAVVLSRVGRRMLLVLAATMAFVMSVNAADQGTFDLGASAVNFSCAFSRVLLSYSIGCWLYLTVRDRPPVAVPVWVPPLTLVALLFAGWAMGPADWRFDLAFVLLACPLILLGGLSPAGKARRLCAFLGDLSFPLYAVHMPILHLVAEAGLPWFAAPPIALAAAWLVLEVTRPGRLAVLTAWRRPRASLRAPA